MNSDSEQTSLDDGSANKYSHKTSSNASGRQWRLSAWEVRLSELADYRKIHGHCNVPHNYSEKSKLGHWVTNQRQQYKLHLEGKTSYMTLSRIQELESLAFEWVICVTAWEDRLNELAEYRKIHGHCNVPRRNNENSKLGGWVMNQRTQYRWYLEGKKSPMTLLRSQELESLGFEWKPSNSRNGTSKKRKLDDDATRTHERAMDATIRANPVAVQPLQHRHTVFIHALLLGDGSTGNGAQATPDEAADAPQDMQQMPQDELFQSDNVLSEVELELIWLGEESMYCLVCPEFQFDFIYEYASSALKVELRKLSRDDQSETEKLKQVVRMEDWLVSQRLDFVRKDIRMMLRRGFRRQRMRTVIASLRLLQRQQSDRHFPAMILGRTETAPVKASAVIE
jgi:hypothetical protein